MGMYDSIIIDKMICPRCKQEIKNVEFQTKALFNLLNCYHLGDTVATNMRSFSALTDCPACTEIIRTPKFQVCYTWLEAFVYLEDAPDNMGRIVRLEVWRYKHDIPKSERPIFLANNV
jgi:hypothetical protein